MRNRSLAFAALLLALGTCAYALHPFLDIGQYAHTSLGIADFRGGRRERVNSPPRGFENIEAPGGDVPVRELRFTHLITNDGLSQGYVTAILQDRRGFMWFATRDGLNRYDGNAFVVYKNNPNDPDSLSSNFIQDLVEDDRGHLWVATNSGVNNFDPTTERVTRYLHDPKNPNSFGGAFSTSIACGSRGHVWFGTQDSGLDQFDPTTGIFTHYLNDSDGQFVGRLTHVIEDRHGEVWFVGERGLFHLNPATGQITRVPATRNGLSSDRVYEDEAGNLWMLANSPIVGLVKYDPQVDRLTTYPLSAPAGGVQAWTLHGGSTKGSLVADGQNGFWVSSSLGLSYFDRRKERFTYRFQHDDSNSDSLDSNAVMSAYRDRGGVLWVGTENAGLNILDFRQEQFVVYKHRPADPSSLSPGRVKAIYRETNGVLWLGFFPRALDRLDRNTGQITHYVPHRGDKNMMGEGTNVSSIYKDSAGYLWVGGGGCGLVRFDERTGRFKRYRHDPDDPNSLSSNDVITIYGDRSGRIWVGQQYGLSRYDPATDGFINYWPVPNHATNPANWVWTIYQDRSGTLWLGTFGGALIRFDDKIKTFVPYAPDSRDPSKLNGGGITTIHEDRKGTLWVGGFDGLYRFNRRSGAFARYTETQGLPSSTIRCILEDRVGRLWLSTQKGISRFDPKTESFRNYDASDGLQSNEFSDGCYESADGEMFFGGSNGFNAFFPENVRDNPYVPPIVITSLKIFNKPVPICAKSVLKKAIPYVDSLTLSYRDNIFSFEFAALSYANSQKNRYRYRLEGLEPGWNEVDSKHRLATYTNLDPGKYVFRVQGSNSDGVWNEEGVTLPIVITPPWWNTSWFRALCAALLLALLRAAYQLRVRQLVRDFNVRVEERVNERTRIARELHDTLLQSFQASLVQMQTARTVLSRRPEQAGGTLDQAIDTAEGAIAEGRDAIHDLRSQPAHSNFAKLLTLAGQELAIAHCTEGKNPALFRAAVEGEKRKIKPLIQDEAYRIGRELLRNAFQHADASEIEAEIRYEDRWLRVRVRDDGKGIDPKIVTAGGRTGHWGLLGMRERAKRIGGQLDIWSQAGAGTEVELSIPSAIAYEAADDGRGPFALFHRKRAQS
jgi:ligand-binding sensor domain-containing protein/signal transduction histidine kinase